MLVVTSNNILDFSKWSTLSVPYIHAAHHQNMNCSNICENWAQLSTQYWSTSSFLCVPNLKCPALWGFSQNKKKTESLSYLSKCVLIWYISKSTVFLVWEIMPSCFIIYMYMMGRTCTIVEIILVQKIDRTCSTMTSKSNKSFMCNLCT